MDIGRSLFRRRTAATIAGTSLAGFGAGAVLGGAETTAVAYYLVGAALVAAATSLALATQLTTVLGRGASGRKAKTPPARPRAWRAVLGYEDELVALAAVIFGVVAIIDESVALAAAAGLLGLLAGGGRLTGARKK
ncbi:MAG TPA: hypothetical protein VG318_07145 [Actinomycetota bacterium]|nr:hypothetical protein [Actinomycetota bacterium]